ISAEFDDISGDGYTLSENVEHLNASAYVNGIELTGNALANTITGTGGNDDLVGSDGNDTLIGGAGDDELVGGAGIDNLQGGTGSDAYYVNLKVTSGTASLEDSITDTAGTDDTLILSGGTGTTKASTIVLAAALEHLDASNLDSGIAVNINFTGNASSNDITGSDGNNTILGLAGDDDLEGGDGNDTLDGGIGNDELEGDGGNDSLIGGAGEDSLAGGEGDDIYTVNLIKDGTNAILEDTVAELEDEGADTIKLVGSAVFTTNTLIDMTDSIYANVEHLDISGTASTKLDISGTDEDNYLTGNAAANVLTGGLGNDTLDGGLGNDTLIGGDGNDLYIINAIGDVVDEEGLVDSDADTI
ncbi:calcium-binding protein, partial [Methylovorus sp. MM2]|uniref:calcium-binding protein n=1 Tax=Methylovorus sp. MM2 TaxID=1848038 RepID=UPI0010421BB2